LQEEQQKLAARAERFGLQSQGLQYVPPAVPEDEAKKKARAERFGVEYQPTDETGLMDVGKQRPRSLGGLGFRDFQGVSRGVLGVALCWLRPCLAVWPFFL
jgi:hypothetical protein